MSETVKVTASSAWRVKRSLSHEILVTQNFGNIRLYCRNNCNQYFTALVPEETNDQWVMLKAFELLQ